MSKYNICRLCVPKNIMSSKNCTSSNLARLLDTAKYTRFVYLIQRQNSRYFRCPVWKTKMTKCW